MCGSENSYTFNHIVQVGLLDLKITATSSVGKDLLIKQLRVEPEGETIFVNKPVFLDLRAGGSDDEDARFDQ